MKLRCAGLIIAAASMGALVSAADAQDRTVAVVGAKIIDGTSSPPISDGVLIFRGGTIMNVGPAAAVEIPPDARRVELRGKTIIPGLIDAHVHPGLIEGMDISAENYSFGRVERDARYHLFFGTTHFVSLGFDQQAIFDLRQAQQEGRAGGARAHMAGHGFAPVKGWRTPVPHGSAQDSAWYNRPRDADEARQLVRREASRKVDVIKVWVDDLRGAFVKMTADLYGPIIEEAHRQGLPVGAHIVFLEDARDLVRNDVNFLAHSIRDKEVDSEFVRLAQAKGMAYMPTLLQARFPIDYADGVPPYLADAELRRIYAPDYLDTLAKVNQRRFSAMPTLPATRDQFRIAMANVKRMFDAGIPIVAGGDTGVPGRFHGLSVHLEMQLLVEGGLPAVRAIQAATLNTARLYRFDKRHGSLHEGKVADFVVLNGDPTEDIRQTRSIAAVWLEGAEIDREALLSSTSRRGEQEPGAKSFVRFARNTAQCFHPFCHQH